MRERISHSVLAEIVPLRSFTDEEFSKTGKTNRLYSRTRRESLCLRRGGGIARGGGPYLRPAPEKPTLPVY